MIPPGSRYDRRDSIRRFQGDGCCRHTGDRSRAREEITLLQRWPVRIGRPYVEKMSPTAPLFTGQRPIDTFSLLPRRTATVPGPFGSGKTVIQHQLAKWAEAGVVVYIGCGSAAMR